MKQFACGAVVPGCHHVFKAQDNEKILAMVAAHAREDHGLTEISPELVFAVEQNITDLVA